MIAHPVLAARVRAAMRREGVTIRAVAAAMKVTLKRVREVRDHGLLPAGASVGLYACDWFDGIRAAGQAMDWNDRMRAIECQGRSS